MLISFEACLKVSLFGDILFTVCVSSLFQLVTFEVPHKPGYRLRMRMGIHTGSCVAGVVGTKIPHYSVFGETIEIAGMMEASGEPMKIQAILRFINYKGKTNFEQKCCHQLIAAPSALFGLVFGGSGRNSKNFQEMCVVCK